MENKILNQGYLLKPNFSDQMKDSAQFALGALVASEIQKNSAILFDYWIRIALVRELAVRFWDDPDAHKSDIRTNGPSIEDLISHCAMYYDRSPRYVARFAVSYMRSLKGHCKSNKSTDSWQGTLPLYGLAKKAKSEKDPSRIDTVIEQIEMATDEPLAAVAAMVAGLPLSGVIDHTGNTLPVYSFHSLLGVIGELIYAVKDACLQKNDSGNDQNLKAAIYRVLKTNSQFKEYPLPEWSSSMSVADTGSSDNSSPGKDSSNTSTEEEMINLPDNEDIPSCFLEKIVKWVETGEEIHVTPALLGKIFTRFFYTLNNMDKEPELKNKCLGEWMHRMIVAFLNAVVVMESLDKVNLQHVGISLHNPRTNNKNFRINLQKLNANEVEAKKLIFSKWLLACPIWPFFMNPESEEDDKQDEDSRLIRKTFQLHPKITSKSLLELHRFTEQGANELEYISLYSELNTVFVVGHGKKIKKNKLKKFSISDQEHLMAAIKLLKKVIEENKPEDLEKDFNEIEFSNDIKKKFKKKLIEELEEIYEMSGVASRNPANAIIKKIKEDPNLWK